MRFALTAALAATFLSSCEAKITGPERQECTNIKTGETFRFRLQTVKQYEDGIAFVDEQGWKRVATPASQLDFKCREIPVEGGDAD